MRHKKWLRPARERAAAGLAFVAACALLAFGSIGAVIPTLPAAADSLTKTYISDDDLDRSVIGADQPVNACHRYFTFSGSVNEMVDEAGLWPWIQVGTKFTAILTFDANQPDSIASPDMGMYEFQGHSEGSLTAYFDLWTVNTQLMHIVILNDSVNGDGFHARAPTSYSDYRVLFPPMISIDCTGDSSVYVDDSLPEDFVLTDFSNGCVFGMSYQLIMPTEFGNLTGQVLSIFAADADLDGLHDHADNCSLVYNPDQIDTDLDGFGNACDADLNGDCMVNTTDLGLFKSVFFSDYAHADFNGDGVVNPLDLGIFRSLVFLPPGPSGLANDCN